MLKNIFRSFLGIFCEEIFLVLWGALGGASVGAVRDALRYNYGRTALIYIYGEAVVARVDVGGKTALELGVEADFVVEVGDVGFSGFYFFYQLEGFGYVEVGEVFAVAQCVDDEHFQPVELLHLFFRNGLCIGYVGEIADSVADDGELSVHHADGDYFQAVDVEGFVADFVHIKSRNTGIGVLSEAIVKTAVEVVVDIGAHIHRHIAVDAERTQVINATDMVIVAVGDKGGVYVIDVMLQGLLAEVG